MDRREQGGQFSFIRCGGRWIIDNPLYGWWICEEDSRVQPGPGYAAVRRRIPTPARREFWPPFAMFTFRVILAACYDVEIAVVVESRFRPRRMVSQRPPPAGSFTNTRIRIRARSDVDVDGDT
ncbi:hypothetical protein M413DRAFT_254183 [Hebeloma cylindrosporum]|uniref:Uncharacterized protein n=1 Tax=Hebeloma cylindrosporum TaxID=76867 RepID=A0A0C3C268_HEBCY|nr:hypothetical protein M413DRAFT_254183 [Hebeloma cylindrosporum h7]